MIRRTITMLAAAIWLTAYLAVPAWAASVSADCAGGGYFTTKGTADDWQDHVHDGVLWHTWYYGRATKSHTWGWETGTEGGTVNGPNLAYPGAVCFA